jgi:signal transduction histidine kinase
MEAIGQLTGGIAHDFNNLLTAILGNVEMIARRATDERVQRMAGYAREAVSRATKLTGQLLAFSRSQQLDLRAVAVDSLIDGMDDLLARSLGHAIELRTELKAGRTAAIADANQLELAILNLAINARDAMPGGGTLTIGTRMESSWGQDLKPGRYLVISVMDTGAGIPPAVMNKVFDPFFTTKSVGKGTGLGLSQVYGIARQSGGIARIRNGEHRGAVVEIWLPVAEGAEAERPTHDLVGDMPRGSGRRCWSWTMTRTSAVSSSSVLTISTTRSLRPITARPAWIGWVAICPTSWSWISPCPA